MSRTSARLPDQQGAEFYIWSFPGAPVQVQLSFKVVQDIRQHLSQSASAGASIPIRGLLLGPVVTTGLPKISGFRPLGSEQSVELEEAISSIRNSGDNLIPVGYFRSHTGDRLALSPEDIFLAETHFSDPNCVLLLVDLSAPVAPNAGFFYWDRGKMNGGFYDFCFLEFPFDAALMKDGARGPAKDSEPHPESQTSTLAAAAEPVPDPKPTEAPAVPTQPPVLTLASSAKPLSTTELQQPAIPPQSLQESRKPSRFWRVAGVTLLAAACLAAAGIFLTPKLIDLFTKSGQSPIALKVERQGRDLSVTWNHNSPIVLQAESGRLTIYDGATREFPLDKDHIRSGTIVYSPITPQVDVQLQIQMADHKTVSESVQVILGRPELTESSAVEEPAKPASANRDAASSLLSAAPQNNKPQATREFLPPREPGGSAHAQSSELAEPPPLTAVHSPPMPIAEPPLALPRGQSPPPKPATPNPRTTPPAPAPAPPPTRLADRLSPIPDYVPPAAIHQVPPTRLSPAQRSFLSRPVVIEIKAFIDASGKVYKTEPLTRANPVLVTAARSAAILWTFQPARREGLNVASELVLRFKFEPAAP